MSKMAQYYADCEERVSEQFLLPKILQALERVTLGHVDAPDDAADLLDRITAQPLADAITRRKAVPDGTT